MNKSLIVLIIIIASATLMYIISGFAKVTPTACTKEAKICPDGSSVGRSGPKCEFAQCPATILKVIPSPSPISQKEYKCPTGSGINCMPRIDKKNKEDCSSDAIKWYKANCPNFKGAVY